jgi:hypothetical protein
MNYVMNIPTLLLRKVFFRILNNMAPMQELLKASSLVTNEALEVDKWDSVRR